MKIRLYSDEDHARWDKYVNDSSVSTLYHLSGWKHIVEKSFNHKAFYLFAENSDKEVKGVLPIIHLKSYLFGNYMVSLPYFTYGGLCSEDEEISDALLKEAISIARREKVGHIELRHTKELHNDLQVKTSKVSMILELTNDSDMLWKTFSSNLRRKIRKPTKEGMYLKIGQENELNNFYRIFSINMRDLGTPVYSKVFFENILKTFPERSWILTVYTKDNKPISSAFLIGFKERIEMPWVSSIRGYNKSYPNAFLYWSSLKFACENGYKVFDFGRSTPGEGTYRFKEQWGAKPIQLYWHYWLKDKGPLPEINTKNPKYHMAIKIWQKLPISLTKLFGPMIVKNLP